MKTESPKSAGKTTVTTTISPPPVMLDILPVSSRQTFTIEVESFGLEHIKKALADSEALTHMLRDHPEEMVALVNDTFAGRTESAKRTLPRLACQKKHFKTSAEDGCGAS